MGEHASALGLVRTIPGPFHRARALNNLALAAILAGDHARWEALWAEAEAIARALPHPAARAKVLTALARTAASAGRRELAETAEARLRDRTSNVCHQSRALLNLARAMMTMGDAERAKGLGHHAEALARGIGQTGKRTKIQTELIDLAIAVGDLDWAQALAPGLHDPHKQALSLLRVAHAWADAGTPNRCLALLADISSLSGTLRIHGERSRVLTKLTKILTLLGLYERAEGAALRIPEPPQQVRALAELATHVEERHARQAIADEQLTASGSESSSRFNPSPTDHS
ncbi:hypothetical protein AB0O76_43365 [Streptomyces sp. NPDC086554]|uniref:hypothetical protein n=1 Tax=Streptomyces sp. NPDC086554 TaxID=3154864 RepID=UPI003436A007